MSTNTVIFRNDAHAKKEGFKGSALQIGLRYSYGNSKLGNNDTIQFFIWAMTSNYSERLQMPICVLATPNCIKSCYALRDERIYPTVRERRHMNLVASLKETFEQDMIEQIEFDMKRKKFEGKKILFRIHEGADYYSYAYMVKWHNIATHFKNTGANIQFMSYTKSLPFVKRLYKEYGQENVYINFKSSIWADTSKAMIKLTNELDLSVFTALTPEKLETKDYSSYFKCPSMGGATCGDCVTRYENANCYTGKKHTAIEIH